MKVTLLKIWTANFLEVLELRADFSNNRYHAVAIEKPYEQEQVLRALSLLADVISCDPHLKE